LPVSADRQPRSGPAEASAGARAGSCQGYEGEPVRHIGSVDMIDAEAEETRAKAGRRIRASAGFTKLPRLGAVPLGAIRTASWTRRSSSFAIRRDRAGERDRSLRSAAGPAWRRTCTG